MSYQLDDEETYQPSVLIRLLIAISLIGASFTIPYALLHFNSTAAKPSNVVVIPVSKGTLPQELRFDNDAEIPSDSSISIQRPTESGWSLTSNKGGLLSYNYEPLACTVTAEIVNQKFTQKGEDASVELLTKQISSPPEQAAEIINNIRYNINGEAEMIGVGAKNGSGEYEFIAVRGFTSLNKGLVIITTCANQQNMEEASDDLRDQFGVLIKP